MRAIRLIEELRYVWGAASLLFPARRRVRQLEAENARLRSRAGDLERFRGVAVDVSASLHAAAERVGQPAP